MPPKRKKRAASMKDSGTPRTASGKNAKMANTLRASSVDVLTTVQPPPIKIPVLTFTLAREKSNTPIQSVQTESSDESDINSASKTEDSNQNQEALLQKIADLEKVNNSVTDLNSTIKKELRKLGQEVECLRNANGSDDKSEEIMNIRNQCDAEKDELTRENKDLTARLAVFQRRISEIPTLELAIIKLEHEKKELQGKLKTTEGKLTATEQQLLDKKNELQGQNSPVEKMIRCKLIETLKQKNERLEEELSEANQSVKSLKINNVANGSAKQPSKEEHLTAELEEAKSTIEALREQIREHANRSQPSSSTSTETEKPSSAISNEIGQLKSQLAESKQANNDTTEELAVAKQAIENHRNHISRLTNQLRSTPSEEAKNSNSGSEAVAKDLMMSDLSTLRDEITGNQLVVKDLREEISTLGDRSLALKSSIKDLTGEKEGLETAVDNLKKNHSTLVVEIDGLIKKRNLARHRSKSSSKASTKPSTPPPNPKVRSIFVMRHAERADDTTGWKDTVRPYDTPITANGEKEAEVSANKIKEGLTSLGNTKQCLLIVSPYRRCLETASVVLKTFPASELLVHHGFGEVGSRIEGKKVPVFHNSGYSLAKGSVEPSFPETREDAARRAKQAFANILNLPEYSQYNIIIVTHGDIVDFCCPKDIYGVETTAFVHMIMDSQGGPLELKSVHRIKYFNT